jgi:hypothetical protein
VPADRFRLVAFEMKRAFEAVSPFIEGHTAAVCPSCEKVCCIDRHGSYEPEDHVFLMALGEEPPGRAPKKNDTEPCRYLTPRGCLLPRWKRPYRCTWYFCPGLLEAMPRGNPRGYRRFLAALGGLMALRQRLQEMAAPGG